jgi:cellulose synthase/poly-beta-1,6-N-acetylglucosamine synthase-like glycosyltransferase
VRSLNILVPLWDTLGVLLLLPCAVLITEVLCALKRRSAEGGTTRSHPSVAIVVPAHDEARIIAQTLQSIRSELRECDRLVVVADNCSDPTAAVAAAAGAETLERIDSVRRGKGYALDFAVRYLERDARDVVIVIDADCRIAPGAIARLARQSADTGRPAQARYRLLAPDGAGLSTRLKAFACSLKNEGRPLGLHRLGLPCQLTGSGMAFPWSIIRSARLASAEIVEDLQLGIDLTRARTAPIFCPDAIVTSELPASSEGSRSQRARWEHGHLAVMLREGPRLLLSSLARRDWSGVALAADLMVPPLALLLLLLGAHWLVSLWLYVSSTALMPLLCSTLAAALLGSAVLLGWLRYGNNLIPLRALVLAPLYALGKVPLYARFVRSRQQTWVRSRRDHEARERRGL